MGVCAIICLILHAMIVCIQSFFSLFDKTIRLIWPFYMHILNVELGLLKKHLCIISVTNLHDGCSNRLNWNRFSVLVFHRQLISRWRNANQHIERFKPAIKFVWYFMLTNLILPVNKREENNCFQHLFFGDSFTVAWIQEIKSMTLTCI